MNQAGSLRGLAYSAVITMFAVDRLSSAAALPEFGSISLKR
jgi:hypothetical protein